MDIPLYIKNLNINDHFRYVLITSQTPLKCLHKYLVAEWNVIYKTLCLLENPIQPIINVAYFMLNSQRNWHKFGFFNSAMYILKFI